MAPAAAPGATPAEGRRRTGRAVKKPRRFASPAAATAATATSGGEGGEEEEETPVEASEEEEAAEPAARARSRAAPRAASAAAASPAISGDPTKAVVFSSWPSLLQLVRARCGEEGIPTALLEGSMTAAARAAAVAAFQCDAAVKVMLVSMRAGGAGLTLTAAAHAFVLDPAWNPGVQDQAVDRIHRMGQTSAVVVNLLITEGTIEERVVELQARKRALAAGALGGGKTAEEIRAMRLYDLKLLVGV